LCQFRQQHLHDVSDYPGSTDAVCMRNLLSACVWELLFALLFSWVEGQYLKRAED